MQRKQRRLSFEETINERRKKKKNRGIREEGEQTHPLQLKPIR